MGDEAACNNTDRELWRGPDEGNGSYYADSIHVTEGGGIGINCGGSVYVKPLREWHRLAGGPISRCSPMTTSLLPCPFCGGTKIEIIDIEEGPQAGCRVVECYECFGSIGGKIAGPDQISELVKAWNTRVSPSSAELEHANRLLESVPATPEAPGDVAEIVREAIRDFCKSFGNRVCVVSSDGIERIYYSGLPAETLANCIAAAVAAQSSAETAVAPTRANFDSIIAALRYDGPDENSLTVGEIRRALS